MSLLAEDNNNWGMLSEVPNEARPYQYDPKYYYPDGSTVILVGDILFKFQLSLVLDYHGTSNHPTFEDPTFRELLINSSDDNPARLKGYTPNQFRNFLSVVLGLPSDPGYLAFLTGAQDTKNHKRDLLVRYLDVASLSQRFGMIELEAWTRGQLQLVLRSSHKFTQSEWNRDTLHRLHLYAHSSSGSAVRPPVKAFIQYFISVSTDKGQQSSTPTNFNTCIELYKDGTLKQRDSAIFGCAFAAIVSQHHQAWTSPLTQRDKALLYVAQVQLTSATNTLQSLHWLLAPASRLPFFTNMCSTCRSALPRIWADTFGKCGSLNSSVLLQDISSLAHLPQYLHSFSRTWKDVDCIGLPDLTARSHERPSVRSSNPEDPLDLFRSVRLFFPASHEVHEVRARPRESQKCRNNYLPQVGALIDEVYNEFATQHGRFALES
ncbi:unnamed protein product [Rhizoctonia solani]|uniref:Uncharacterized protein n=1 Tax=Rhizoctonia solani TaxID=456999 RepID=A0A8H3CP75_9AGAM|nr:unnamed protein product [Rhizoctonia solani]